MPNETALHPRLAVFGRGPGLAAAMAAFAAVVCAICWGAIELPRELGRAAPIWPANALILAVMLSTPRRQELGWLASAFVGYVAANLLSGNGPLLSLGLSACNLGEVIIAVLLLRRFVGGSVDISRVGDLVRYFAVCMVAPLISAVAARLVILQIRGGDPMGDILTWAAADALGLVTLGPLLLGLRRLPDYLAATPIRASGWAKLALMAGTITISTQMHLQLFFLIPPVMLLVVFELEVLGALLCLVVAMAIGLGATIGGFEPLSRLHLALTDRLLLCQLLLAALTLTTFPTAAVLSQRRRLKSDLDEQYRRVKLAEEIAGVGYWRLHPATGRLDWSDTMAEATGIGAKPGLTLDEVLAQVHAKDRAAVGRVFREAFARGEDRSVSCRFVRPDGEVRHAVLKACCETGRGGKPVALFGTLVDVTDLRRAQEEVAEREARYRLLADVATDVVLKVDHNDVIQYVSPSVRRYGYEPDDLIGVSGYSLVHPDDRPKLQSLITELFSGADVISSRDRTYRVRTAHGDWVWMEGNPAIIRGDTGDTVAVVSQLRDVTARRKMEDDLYEARAEAEAAAAVKGEFLANMSHELRTPLTAVIGFTRLALSQPELSETTRGYIGKASNAGAALLTTVNDILDFSKLESGQLQIRPEACDVAAVCRETLELFTETAAAKGVALSWAAEDLPGRIRLDPDRLRQLLLNLVGNAVKFSDAGEVRLQAAWRAQDQRLLVSVSDDGPGIAAEQQSRLFRRFSQVDGSATRRHGGTGLGLAICLGLVEAMDGSIGVESELGRGARFFFELPAPACEATDDGDAAEAVAAVPPGVRVLVADDHAFNRELVRAVLTPFGAEVTEAADGQEVVDAAARGAFDLILMDMRMPKLDGVAAMQSIRSRRGPNRRTPILAFSAGADAPGAEERRAAGFDGDLAKPVMPGDLLAAVARFAGTRSAPQASKPRRRAAGKT